MSITGLTDLGRSGARTLVSSFPSFQKGGIRLETFLEHQQVSVRCEVVGRVKRSLGDHRRRGRPGGHGFRRAVRKRGFCVFLVNRRGCRCGRGEGEDVWSSTSVKTRGMIDQWSLYDFAIPPSPGCRGRRAAHGPH